VFFVRLAVSNRLQIWAVGVCPVVILDCITVLMDSYPKTICCSNGDDTEVFGVGRHDSLELHSGLESTDKTFGNLQKNS